MSRSHPANPPAYLPDFTTRKVQAVPGGLPVDVPDSLAGTGAVAEEPVRPLVLGEPPLFSWLTDTPEGEAMLAAFLADVWAPARRLCEQGEMESGMRHFIDGVIGEGAFDQCPAPIQTEILDNAVEMAVELGTPQDLIFSTLARKDVRAVSAPTLLLSGELSPPLFGYVIDQLAAVMTRAERHVIPGVSHDLGDPATFTGPVLRFLAERG